MNIEEIENKIVEKLKGKLTDLLVDSFPEKPQDFVFTHPKGAVLVHYQGGICGNIECVGAVFQNKKMEFAITIVTRSLRTKNSGAYAILEQVKSILTGFRIDGCSKMHPTKEGFLSEANGIWQYTINLEFTTPSIESEDE